MAAEFAYMRKLRGDSVAGRPFQSYHVEAEQGACPVQWRQSDHVVPHGAQDPQQLAHRVTSGSLCVEGQLAFGLAWTFAIGYLIKIAQGQQALLKSNYFN